MKIHIMRSGRQTFPQSYYDNLRKSTETPRVRLPMYWWDVKPIKVEIKFHFEGNFPWKDQSGCFTRVYAELEAPEGSTIKNNLLHLSNGKTLTTEQAMKLLKKNKEYKTAHPSSAIRDNGTIG